MTSLRANTAWALAGNVGYTACQWAVLVVVARLGSATDVGRLALGLALSAPVVILANLQLRAVQATDARREQPFGVYLGLRLVTTATALVAIAALALGLGYDGGTLAVVLAIGLAKGFEAVSDVVFGLLQQAEHLRQIAVSMLARGVLTVAAVGLAVGTTGSLALAMLAMALVWGVWLAAYDLPRAARIASVRPRFAAAPLGAVAWLALPLGCVSFLNSLATNLPRYALEAHAGTASLGRFAALAYLVVATTQPVVALGAATTPRLARYFSTDHAAYRRLARRALGLGALLGVALVVAVALGGRRVLALSYGAAYAGDAAVLVWLAVAAACAFLSTALGWAVTAARRFPPQLAVAVLACVTCGAASQLLVPRWGMLGAAWAVLAGEGTRVVCLVVLWVATCAPRAVAVPEPMAA
jgi:O-antigen/teichoic acid export membrane protein